MKRMTQCTWILLALLALTGTLQAQVGPEKLPGVAEKVLRHPDLDIPAFNQEVRELPAQAAAQARQRLARLGVAEESARVDQRGGRFVTLLPTTPLVPGRGVGNNLRWTDLKVATPQTRAAAEQAAWNSFRGFLEANQADLGIDASELGNHRIASHNGGDLFQIWVGRTFDGIPVRGSSIIATIGQGNLSLMSTERWGDRPKASNRPQIDADEAFLAAESYLAPVTVTREWGKPEQVWVPMANGQVPQGVGNGYRYQLVWSIKVEVDGDQGSWELLVDAHTGEVLANEDQNAYAEAKGGVYPKTNDGIVPDGAEQPGWPMPWMFVGSATTDTGGNYNLTGSQTATFNGPYVNMADNCGTDSLTQTGGIDWGTSGGTDCTTPGFGGTGNTHSSRSGFYELNRIKEMARSQLPSNSWLQAKLTANMNINNTCNAFWNGSTVNFYRSGGGCANTGEIAAVFDHEWGHGMDANDVVGGIASPSGEGVADIYSALRLEDSCIGRNFTTSNCSGNGDPCLNCTGVRDIDYLKRQSGNPHTYTWSNSNCGGSVHCVGAVYSEAVWSLWKRKLPTLYGIDNNTAHEIVTRLTYIGAGATSTWFSGGPPNGGCGGTSGYMNYLAADDDNGNLNDGTPHMTAIYQSFNDQQIACQTPTVQDSGCASTPTAAPNVTATPGNNSVALSWGSIAGASSYEVFRAEGIFQCDFGKVKIASTTGTSFTDTGLQNGRDYSYVVIPKGSSAACFGSASACDTVQPVGAPPVPDFAVSCTPGSHTIQQGNQATSTCTVTALNGYTGSVGLSCSGNPAGIGCSFAPGTVSPTGNSTLTLSVNLSQSTGTFNFNVVGNDGSATRTSAMSVTVTPEGQNGPQIAVYDAGLGAPRCSLPGSSCDSTTLLNSRDTLATPEPNQPNTVDTCTDGGSGTYHSDESNDRIVVSTLDGLDFTEGATVRIDATVWAWTTASSDALDLYYAADATSPTWVFLATIVPPSAGAHTLSTQYTLPTGGLQAVRAHFRYLGSATSCSTGSYDDADDLVFAVNTAGPVCVIDADCNDGLYCNGTETCNAGSCQAGTAVVCNDLVSCTVDSCNEGTDSCDFTPNDSLCSNGLFCDGSETCSATLGCQAGTPVVCNDGISCTIDSCNEGTDSCDAAPNDAVCDNGLFCDGAEFCSLTLDCQDAPDPCSGAQTCNETTDICEGGGPCTHSANFESGAGGWTAGVNTCTTGAFVVGVPDATAWQVGGGNPGSAFFTAPNPGGVGTNDVDGGTCEALSPVVDCNGQPAALISLDYFHGQRDTGGDPNDGFRIDVLNNGVVVDTMVAFGDVTVNPVWTPLSTVVVSPGNIQLRVRATDATATGDIVEGGIDNVSISPTTPPSCVVDDDFEAGAPAWFNDAASTCTTGAYVTGNPTNATSGYQIVGSHSGVTSIFTAVNTSAGIDDVDGGNCILGSPTWAVPAASTLSVWYWHGQRDAGGDPTGDFFRLEVSTNGGATWTTLASNGDATSIPVWLNATAAIPAGSNVQLRMQCSDGTASGDLVECGLDDVSICN